MTVLNNVDCVGVVFACVVAWAGREGLIDCLFVCSRGGGGGG